jgi:Type II secretion system (T2SS), protein G
MYRRIFLKIAALVLLLSLVPSTSAAISQKDARNAIARMAGMSLPRSSVHINRVTSSSNSVAEISADLELAFRFEEEPERVWRIRDLRVAEGGWEDLSLFTEAAKLNVSPTNCDLKDSSQRVIARLSTSRSRCLAADLFGVPLPSDAVRIKTVSMQGLGLKRSALVVAVITADFRLTRESGSWKATAFRTGGRDWLDLAATSTAIDALKRTRATVEMNQIVAALEAYRQESGSFIVTDKHPVVIDRLNPQFLHSVIRVDPWRNSYIYKGEANSFTLKSAGPDGKENTADDIVLSR